MKKLLISVVMLAAVCFGDPVTFVPSYNFSASMAHESAYTWGMNFNLGADEEITYAALTITGLKYDSPSTYNALWIDLLDNVTIYDPQYANVVYVWDGEQSSDIDRFAAAGVTNSNLNQSVEGGVRIDRLNYNQDYSSVPANTNDGWYSTRSGSHELLTSSPSLTRSIVFTSDELEILTSYIINNGVFGFGFDADCHYSASGISFTMETRPVSVPEPATLSLLGAGLLGLAFIRKRK